MVLKLFYLENVLQQGGGVDRALYPLAGLELSTDHAGLEFPEMHLPLHPKCVALLIL